MASNIVVYDLTVSKIWCTMCANKIKSSFEGQPGIQYVQVNVMAERVIISFDQDIITMNQIKEIFEKNNFFIVGQPRLINNDSNQQRTCQFFFPNSEYDLEELVDTLNKYMIIQFLCFLHLKSRIQRNIEQILNTQRICKIINIINFQHYKKQSLQRILRRIKWDIRIIFQIKQKSIFQITFLQSGQLMSINYQPLSISGHQLKLFIESFVKDKIIKNDEKENLDADLSLIIYNQLLEKFRKKEQHVESVTQKKLILAITLSALFLILCSIMPHFEFYTPVLTYPNEKSIYSVYLILIFVMTTLTLIKFGIIKSKQYQFSQFIQVFLNKFNTYIQILFEIKIE